MLLQTLARRPVDYGLDHRHAALTNVLEFAIRNPACIGDAEESAGRKVKRCLERTRRGAADTVAKWRTHFFGMQVLSPQDLTMSGEFANRAI